MVTQPPETLALWNRVCTTNPAMTKRVDQRGGFTAICAHSQVRAATEEWGPYGHRWGVRDLCWEHVRNAQGEPIELALNATFFYPVGDQEASFPLASDIKFRAGDDSHKKALTDLTTKALSKLGFNADVFMGLFDDHKYVQQRRAEEREKASDKGDGGNGQSGGNGEPDTAAVMCPECGKPMKVRESKGGGMFMGCTSYPACKHTQEVPKTGDEDDEASALARAKRDLSAAYKGALADYNKNAAKPIVAPLAKKRQEILLTLLNLASKDEDGASKIDICHKAIDLLQGKVEGAAVDLESGELVKSEPAAT